MFSSVCALPSPASAEGCPSLFGWFTGVGSEEARISAGLRPPLKLHVRFSRMQLSRRLMPAGCKRRNQPHQVHKLILTVQRRRRQLLPTAITPTFKPMRPDPPHDPTVELIEELSDVSSFVILAPPPQKRV